MSPAWGLRTARCTRLRAAVIRLLKRNAKNKLGVMAAPTTVRKSEPPVPAVPAVRALAAADETELLARMTESIRETPDLAANAETALLTGQGLLALLEGRPGEAVEQLELAIERERRLGRTYPAACLELDLASALEAAGRTDASNDVRKRVASFLEPLGCVNPF